MFWTGDDIRPAVETAEKLLGKPNQYLEQPSHFNVSILTREYGKLWFGDISFTDDFKEKLEMLSVTINQRVYLSLDYLHETAFYTTTSKLREVTE